MDYFLFVLSGLLILLGGIGAVFPVLPGPILSFAGLLTLYFLSIKPFAMSFIAVFALIAVLVTVFDYLMPALGAKKFQGSKYGIWSSTIGIFFGFFFPPLGFILGPFIGAFIGEAATGKDLNRSLKAAFGTFVGFLAGTGMKLVFSIVCLYYYLKILLI